MAIWPFNRKKKAESDLPKEVQDYYQAEKRERVGVAGLLAVATLLVTVVLAIGLFFGGRWLYRAIFDDSDTSDDTSQQEQQQGEERSEGEQSEDAQPEQSGDQGDEGDETLPGTPESTPTTPTPTPTPAPTTPSTPPSSSGSSTTTTSPDSLVNTGPEDTAAIVVGVAAISGAGFYLIRRKQEQE